jgi:hypothetical protein
MHSFHDKHNGIVLNFNADWSGQVRLAWYDPSEYQDPGPTPPSLRECWCDGRDLVAGLFTPTSGPPDKSPSHAPPVDVLTRAVALAVEDYLRSKLARTLDGDLFIERRKLFDEWSAL